MGLKPAVEKRRWVVDELDEGLAQDADCVVVFEDLRMGEDEERDVEGEDVGGSVGQWETEVLRHFQDLQSHPVY